MPLAPDPPLPKSVWLTQQLRALIQHLSPGDSLPTVLQIRERFGVSQPTVDRALQTLRLEGVIESRRGSGIYVTDGAHSHRIGLAFGMSIPTSPASQFFLLLWQALQAVVARRGIPLRYYFIDVTTDHFHHERDQLRADLLAREVHGVILISLDPIFLPVPGVPHVSFGHTASAAHVEMDGRMLIRLAVGALADAGGRKVGLLCHQQAPIREPEIATFIETLAQHGLTTRPEWILPYASPAQSTAGELFAQRWPTWHERPDCLVIDDDNATVSLLHTAAALGISIPAQLQIASHSNVGSTLLDGAPVLRVAFDIHEVAEALVDRLVGQLRGQLTPDPFALIHPRLLA